MRLGRAQPFKPIIKKVLLTGTVTGAIASAAGVGTALGIGESTSAQVASSSGTSTASFFSAQSSIFNATGTSTAAATGAAIDSEIASSAGAGQGAAVSASTSAQRASASGVATGSWISAPVVTIGAVGSAAGVGSAAAISDSRSAGRNLDGGGGHTKKLPEGWWNSPKYNQAIRAKKPLERPEREKITQALGDPLIAQLVQPFQTPQGIDWGELESEQATQALRQQLAHYMQAQQEIEDEEAFLILA